MLALVLVNVLGAVVFAGTYALGSAMGDAPRTFLAVLVLAFLAVTAVWVHVEQRFRGIEAVRRVGRVVLGLLVVVIGLPIVVLMPLFWLESQLPLEAVPSLHLGPVMALLLVSLALVVTVNVAGAVVTVALGLGRHWRGHRA